jgi:AhpD family alkylhydroperoxidase
MPRRRTDPVESHALLSDEVKRHYLAYYRMVFRDGAIDLRTKELIAFAVALTTAAPNVTRGHLEKLRKLGVTEAEIDEATAVALGVTGAALVDRGDIANAAAKASRRGRKP